MGKVWIIGVMLVLSACGEQADLGGDPGSVVSGQALFEQPLEGGNTFACVTCHALKEPAEDGMRRAGHALADATKRPHYKNGQLEDMLDAVNSCLTEWMRSEPWSEGDPRWVALHDYLEAQAPEGQAQPLSFEIASPPLDTSGGDAEAGRALFNMSCALCHGADAIGTARAPSLLGLDLQGEYIARRVRTSGQSQSPVYDGLTGGAMPFFAADRLSDAELLDLVAFVETAEPLDEVGDNNSPGEVEVPDCVSTHPLVGTTRTLSTRFHGVSGTVTVVNDCAVRIDDFHFDGGGIDVRIFGGADLGFGDGFIMSSGLVRSPGYEGETVVGVLPEGMTLDDLGAISVWCVPVGVSFGDASLR